MTESEDLNFLNMALHHFANSRYIFSIIVQKFTEISLGEVFSAPYSAHI